MPSTPTPDTGGILPLHAKDVTVSRRKVAGDPLRVEAMTRSRDHQIDESLSHVRAEVERVLIGRPVAAVPSIREEGDTTNPSVVEEIIVIERRLILKEEVHIRRVHVAERHQETVAVRGQSVEIPCIGRFSSAWGQSPSSFGCRYPHFAGTEMMTEQTIVAVYDKFIDADAAVRDLEAANVPSQAISRHEGRTETTATTSAPIRKEGFWARLFDSEPDHDTSIYDRSIDSGSSVVAVKVASGHVDRVSSILETHHPIDLDERSAHYLASGTTMDTTSPIAPVTNAPMMGTAHTSAPAASESGTIQLAEETLAVGKRAVRSATTRIRRFVVETRVQEQVSLRDETVTLERHAVTDGRPVGATDFTDKVVEMTETSEEAVASKTVRVVEEVNLRKDVTDRVETVKDTLRRDEVEIEKVPGESVGTRAAGAVPAMPALPPKI